MVGHREFLVHSCTVRGFQKFINNPSNGLCSLYIYTMIKCLLVLVSLAQLCLGFRTGPGYVHLDTFRKPSASGDSQLRKRDAYELQLANTQGAEYFVNISVGSPAQELTLQIDTGSSDLWVMSSGNPECAQNEKQRKEALNGKGDFILCDKGTFNENATTTINVTDDPFMIIYGDDSMSLGRWVTDRVQLGNITIDDMYIGLALVSNVTGMGGILGIGLAAGESSPSQYSNFPSRLAQDGLISANAYSLWLDDLNSQKGSILFGGVDHAKYSGPLYTFPIVEMDDGDANSTETNDDSNDGDDDGSEEGPTGPVFLAVTLSSVWVSPDNEFGNSTALVGNVDAPVLLDSGTSLTYLPPNIANGLSELLGAELDDDSGTYVVPCGIEGYLQFNFGELSINASFSNFFDPLFDDITGKPTVNHNNEQLCSIGIGIPGSDSTYILGDTFLRNAYVVYDLDKMEISLAQARHGVSESNVETIDSNGVPSATTVSPTSNATAAETFVYRTFTRTDGQVVFSSNGTSSHSKSHNGAAIARFSNTFMGAIFALVYSVM
uniref:ARAD1D15730p n=1 Tax=Blastobotrys adeninivorans TaxID=409370 RepID=A0A060T939_BLAAD